MKWLFEKLLSLFGGKGTASQFNFKKGEKCFSGPYLDGKLKYYYDETPGERVFNGKFVYDQMRKQLPSGKKRLKVSGTFYENRKYGLWTYEMRSHGVWRRLDVEYDSGSHEGMYHFRFSDETTSIKLKAKGYVRLEMHHGHPVGRIECSVENGKLEGFCDAEGFPDGKWSFNYHSSANTIVDYDEWEHGVLKKQYTLDVATGRKHHRNQSLVKYLSGLIYRESYVLEKKMRKGSNAWDGSICCKNDEI